MKTVSIVKKFIPHGIFIRLQPIYHFLLAFLAALIYRFPSRKLFIIGVTGTKGKTTVVELLHEILQERDIPAASVSSLRFRMGDECTINDKKMTMPGRFFLQSFLYRAAKKGCRYVILEVTSEGIKQFRHRFINFSAAVFTNIEPEHIESHGSFEKYLRAKLDLFWRLTREDSAVLNRDDAHCQRFSASTPAKKIFYGKEGIFLPDKNYAISGLRIGEEGINLDLGGSDISSKLSGEFNLYNILAAAAVGLMQHVPLEKIARAVSEVSAVPGRMEFLQKMPFRVVVDYAHTPRSLRSVYTFLKDRVNPKSEIRNPKLICVLGAAGGGRDKWKRPEFGRIAAEYCDEIILTDEDPYDENPSQILSEIESGISKFPASPAGRQFPISKQIPNSKFQITKHKKILDRREAIRDALRSAKPGDTVVITGKGAEPWIMGAEGAKTPWDDRKVAREEMPVKIPL